MYSLGYYPSSWDRFPLALSGLLVIILALVALCLLLVRRDMLAARTQALAGGLCMSLVWRWHVAMPCFTRSHRQAAQHVFSRR